MSVEVGRLGDLEKGAERLGGLSICVMKTSIVTEGRRACMLVPRALMNKESSGYL